MQRVLPQNLFSNEQNESVVPKMLQSNPFKRVKCLYIFHIMRQYVMVDILCSLPGCDNLVLIGIKVLFSDIYCEIVVISVT